MHFNIPLVGFVLIRVTIELVARYHMSNKLIYRVPLGIGGSQNRGLVGGLPWDLSYLHSAFTGACRVSVTLGIRNLSMVGNHGIIYVRLVYFGLLILHLALFFGLGGRFPFVPCYTLQFDRRREEGCNEPLPAVAPCPVHSPYSPASPD